ncbi:hypothetical protein B0T19DRAFT_350377 [Cercophora scortea]|uniref:Uncharacterized protein n=1 Tax=Cercophora scortea TaxID=314031 RepID=A0AAE0J4K0_9PEZI|nr:hypothetical protein B0T19DRAFT_350377 [Cercophora scortea]
MPPTLDLSRTAHSKTIIYPPRINLRRAASYNHDKGPLSSTSSRFSFNHLVFSPPPSPGLPSLSPPPRRPSKGLAGLVRPSRVIRYTVWLLTAICFFYGATWAFEHSPVPVPALAWTANPHDQYEMVAQDDLPDFPTPIIVTDRKGRPSWTVSIPSSHIFPLTADQYSDIYEKCREVSARVQDLRANKHGLQQAYLGFRPDSASRDFIDVQEAEKAGYLPRSAAVHNLMAAGEGLRGESVGEPVCETSLTFVLESSDAGMGRALMMLWTAYGLAQQEGRAFFVDDTRWAYGKYTDIFQAPPSPKCRAPPRHEMLPCPRHARHLVASAATARELFGVGRSGRLGALAPEALLDESAAATADQKTMFALARQGHDALFHLNKEDSDYVDARVRELTAKRIVPKTKGKQNGLAIGIHVRRGDRHPFEYQYRESYMPLNKYTEAARDMVDDRFNHTGPHGGEDMAAKAHSFLVVASDDPMVYESAEFTATATTTAQDRIKLASKKAIQQANPDKHVMRKFVDETFGWEGGFFAAMFWHLAGGQNVANTLPSLETVRLRSLVGRAYMMDLAVLADASDAVICTVSAVGCRLLAVMMGWDSAVEKGNWINVDGGYGWMGV